MIATIYHNLLESLLAKKVAAPVRNILRPVKNTFERFYVGRLESKGPFVFPAHFDNKTKLTFLLEGYEPNTTDVFRKYVIPGMVVFDIGANIGYYSFLASKLVGESGNVYSFEPEPNNFSLLQENIKRWSSQNVLPVNKAVSIDGGEALLNISSKSGCHSLIGHSKVSGHSVHVSTIDLDSFVKENNIKRVDFIKIDIEGAELLALKGMQNIINSFSPIIICEVNPGFQSSAGYTTVEMLAFFKQNGYIVKYLGEDQEIEEQGYTNIIALKR